MDTTRRTRTLSEHESKLKLAAYSVPLAPERLAATAGEAAGAAAILTPPFVLKLCGEGIAHKTERGLVRLNVAPGDVERVAAELLMLADPGDGDAAVVVAEMVRGRREMIAGLVDDRVFGPCVMVGLGGIFAEALADVAFGLVPLSHADALDMLESLEHQALLGGLRGEPPLDRGRMAAVLVALSRMAESEPAIRSVDVNPLVVVDGVPVAVDALVEVEVGP